MAPHSALPQQAGWPSAALSWPVTQVASRALFEYRADRKVVGRSIDYGGAEGKLFATEALHKGRLVKSKQVKGHARLNMV